jgi:hypothetical protein
MKNKADLSLEQLLLLQSEMRHVGKSLALAYFMLIGGHLGVHRFYLRRMISGSIQLGLFLVAVIAYYAFSIVCTFQDGSWSALSMILLVLTITAGLSLFVWIVVDMCLMPRMVREWNESREEEILQRLRNPHNGTEEPSNA